MRIPVTLEPDGLCRVGRSIDKILKDPDVREALKKKKISTIDLKVDCSRILGSLKPQDVDRLDRDAAELADQIVARCLRIRLGIDPWWYTMKGHQTDKYNASPLWGPGTDQGRSWRKAPYEH